MILWIDPWIRKLWYALVSNTKNNLKVKDAWTIIFNSESMKNRTKQYSRINEILDFFENILSENKIEVLAMERYFFTKFNLSNAEFVYWMRWAILTLALKRWIKIVEYTPLEIKKYITWNAKAWKELLQNFVCKLYWIKNDIKYSDTSDALAIAYLAKDFK